MKRQSVASQIAAHWGWDVADIVDYRYQPSRFTPAVYAGMFNNNEYWSAGRRPPKDRDGDSDLVWKKVESRYPGNGPLWVGTQTKDAE